MIFSLPDVNIWIALAAEGHVDHLSARMVHRTASPSRRLLPENQNGLLRVLTNSEVMWTSLRGLQGPSRIDLPELGSVSSEGKVG
jgi:predicted nucleic acid-binding protein